MDMFDFSSFAVCDSAVEHLRESVQEISDDCGC